MACEKKDAQYLPSVVCTAPSGCPEKEQSSENNQTKFRVLGAITVVAIVVAGVVGVAYLVSHSSSSGGSMLDESKEDHNSEGSRKEVLVQFYYEGKLRSEVITKDEDQNLVTIVDRNTGFIVTQDYDRGIALIKNTTSSDCFFTHLGYIQTTDMRTLTPIVFEEVANATSPLSSNDEAVNLVRSDVIPPEYVQVSNRPAISKQCVDSTSYWLKGTPPSSRVRRLAPRPPAPVTIPPPDLPNWWDSYIVIYVQC
ncbi:hypothetical protein HOLleu_15889 [Holothuria leucospilota]|uniref:BRICHOS domain-containing protein n=1 Tax=Holothuria leucospilota TaxID=206669 RepID=A0A9Q1HAH7_HOLLE|nr:hypothetical protein HOLleu_15889 [Holothuria leucospilota]